ncbi:MAG: SprA-related family protein [Deltaproteobacteria bacterium]|nr:SprA-related family protein [Candidatus Anaeroferrophillacea bacterium]
MDIRVDQKGYGAYTVFGAGAGLTPAGPRIKGQRQVAGADRAAAPAGAVTGNAEASDAGRRESVATAGDAVAGGDEKSAAAGRTRSVTGEPLDSQEEAVVLELRRTDRRVRQHEAAHVAAGGTYVRGGANFSTEVGPDGRAYAVAGEVSIDTSAESTPEATIRKMQTVQRAALAPADPSPQDRAVAAAAGARMAQAQMELMRLRYESQAATGAPTATATGTRVDARA